MNLNRFFLFAQIRTRLDENVRKIRGLPHMAVHTRGQAFFDILPEHAFLFAGRVLALHDTRIAASGSPEEALTALISRLYKIPVRIRRDEQGIMSRVSSAPHS